jgi:hypothetical protein
VQLRTREQVLGNSGLNAHYVAAQIMTTEEVAVSDRSQVGNRPALRSTLTDFVPCPQTSDRGTASASNSMQRRAGEHRLPSSATLNLHEVQPVSMCSPPLLVYKQELRQNERIPSYFMTLYPRALIKMTTGEQQCHLAVMTVLAEIC